MPGAAALREAVWFEERASAADGYGNQEGAWVKRFRRAAEIKPRIGGEQVLAARLSGVQPLTVTVRSDTVTRAISPAWRLVNVRTDAVYAIHAIANPDQKNRYLELFVEEGVADG